MDRKSIVSLSCCFCFLGVLALFILLVLGGSALHSKNTAGVGVLTAMTVKRFNVCEGSVSFVTRKEEHITTNMTLPCASSFVNNTGLLIDISYNWNNPYNAAYNDVSGVLDGCSGCTDTGDDKAKSLLIASIPVGVACLFFAAVACIYNSAPRPNRGAVAPEAGPAQA